MNVTRGVILLVPVVAVSWCTARDHLLEAHFEKVTEGMSRDEVVHLMGKPGWEGRCGAKMPTGLPTPCANELGYSETLAPLLPRFYLIWFGNDGRVVRTAPITSP
jgi:hypothetical protein